MKKLVSLLLSLALCFSFLTTTAFATEPDPASEYDAANYALAMELYNKFFSDKVLDTTTHFSAWTLDGSTFIYWTTEAPKKLSLIQMYLPEPYTGSLDFSAADELTTLYYNASGAVDIKLPSSTKLETLSLTAGISSIDLSAYTALKKLYLSDTNITSLDVSKNTALETLNLYNTYISSLDVSKNTDLVTLRLSGTDVSSIDVSKNTALTELSVSLSNITSIDVSNNTALEKLNLDYNNISALNVSNNTALTYLSAIATDITSLDVSNNTALESLDLYDSDIYDLDVSNLTALKDLSVDHSNITELDVTKNTALEYLTFSHTDIDDIDLSANTNLRSIHYDYTKVGSKDLTAFANLVSISATSDLDSSFLKLTQPENGTIEASVYKNDSVALSAIADDGYMLESWTGLPAGEDATSSYLAFDHNGEKLDISATFIVDPNYSPDDDYEDDDDDYEDDDDGYNSYIGSLNEVDTSLYNADDLAVAMDLLDRAGVDTASVEVYTQSWDYDGYCIFAWSDDSPSRLTEIYLNDFYSIKGTVDLAKLDCLTTLDLMYCTGVNDVKLPATDTLEFIDLSRTNISSLDTTKLPALMNLDLENTKVTSLDLSQNPELRVLHLDDCDFKAIDVSHNPELETLDLEDNTNIKSVDISHNPKLEKLDLEDTAVSTLDISNNPELGDLGVDGTDIAALDVSHLESLFSLNVSGTKITEIDVSHNPRLETLNIYDTDIASINLSGNSALYHLDLCNTKITNLDLSHNPELEYICLHDTDIAVLDVSANPYIYDLNITNTKISSLDLSNLSDITYLYIEFSGIESFDCTQYPTLEYISASCDVDFGHFNVKQPANGRILIVKDSEEVYLSSRGNGTTLKNWINAPVDSYKLTSPGIQFYSGDANGTITAEFDSNIFTRLKGKTRYETSFAIADHMVEMLGGKSSNIVLASGKGFADALAGSYLAAEKGAPILMASGENDAELIAQIGKTMSDDGTVYIVGGEAAVTEATENAIKAAGFDVKRLKGKSRYDTNLEILKEGGAYSGNFIVATGKDYADSLSASAVGLPILLVDGSKTDLTDAQKEFLAEVDDPYFYIIGGEAAVSEDIVKALNNYGASYRIKGKTRYETSVKVADFFFYNPASAVVAYGHNFPDGLCGGPLAYYSNSPLILTRTADYSAAAGYISETGIDNAYVLGGASLVSDEAMNDMLAK